MAIVIPFRRVGELARDRQPLTRPKIEEVFGKGVAIIRAPRPGEPVAEPITTAETIRRQQRAAERVFPERFRTPIRIPFTKGRAVSVPKSDILTPVLAGLVTGVVEAIPSVVKTFFQAPKVIREGRLPSPTGEERVLSAFEIGGGIRDSLIAKGTKKETAEKIGLFAAAGIGVVDILFAGGVTRSFVRAGLRGTERQVAGEIAFHKLGRPKTVEEARQTAREVLREVSPNSSRAQRQGTVDELLAKEVNSSLQVLETDGIPTAISRKTRQFLRTFEMTPQEFAERGFRPLPETVPFARVAGELPGVRPVEGRLQPRVGLAIEEFEEVGRRIVRPIPKELQPLAKEARKFKTAEEFVVSETARTKVARGIDKAHFSKLYRERWNSAPDFADIPRTSRQMIKAIDNLEGELRAIGKSVPPRPEGLIEPLTKSQLTDFFNQVKGVAPVKPPTVRELGLAPELAPFIRKRETTLLKDRIRNIARGTREGSITTRKDILKAGDELKATLKEAGVSPEDAKWFTDTFKNLKGVEDLAIKLPDITARVERLANAREIRELKVDIGRELEVVKPKIGQKKAFESRFGAEAQKRLDFLRGATKEGLTDGRVRGGKGLHIRGSRKQALAEIEKNINKFGVPVEGISPEVPPEIIERNALLNMVGVQEMSVEELRLTLTSIHSLKQTGQLEVLIRQSNKTAELELVKDSAKVEFKPKKVEPKVLGEVGVEINSVLRVAHTIENAILGIRNVVEKATFGNFVVANWVSDTVRVARNAHSRLAPEWNNAKVRKFKEIFGIDKIKNRYRELNKEQLVFKGKDKLGKLVEIKLSQFEGAYWWALSRDPTNIPLFIRNMNFTPEMFKALDKFIVPEMKAYTRYLQDEWLKDIRTLVNERYKIKFGMDMPNNPNYTPRLYSDKKIEEEITNLLVGDAFPNHPSTVPSGVKARIGSTAQFRKISIEQVMRRHSEQMNQFVNFDETISDLRRVFGDPEVREVILSQKGGKQLYDTLTKKIDDIARGGMATQMKLAAIDSLIGNFTKATLMVNWVPFLKQLTSFPAFTLGRSGVTYPELISGAFAYYQNPVMWTKMFAESDFIFGRLTKGFNRETALAFRQGDANFTIKEVEMSLEEFLKKAAITPTRGGDMVPILPGMTAKYLQVTKKLENTTKLSTNEIHTRALAEAETTASRTQQSPHIEDLGRIQTANSVGKAISMYSTTPIQYLRESIGAIRMWNRGQQSTHDMIRSIITAWIILPQLFQWVSDGFTWNNERQLRALLLGPINYYPAAGNMMGTMYDAFAKGETWKSVASGISPLFSIPEKTQQVSALLNKIIFKDGDRDDWLKLAEKTYQVIALLTGKLPATAPRNIKGFVDLIEGDTDDPRRLIFSEYALKTGKETGDGVVGGLDFGFGKRALQGIVPLDFGF